MQALKTNAVTTRPLNTSACFGSRYSSKRNFTVRAQAEERCSLLSRRESMAGLLAAVSAVSVIGRPAQAGLLGITGGKEKEEEYVKLTGEVITDVKNAIALPKDDPARVEAIQKVRDETTKWVAKYRRDGQFQGKASYGNTYSALSALAGHYNNFGPETNVPKKRLDRLTKELLDAEKLIARGR